MFSMMSTVWSRTYCLGISTQGKRRTYGSIPQAWWGKAGRPTNGMASIYRTLLTFDTLELLVRGSNHTIIKKLSTYRLLDTNTIEGVRKRGDEEEMTGRGKWWVDFHPSMLLSSTFQLSSMWSCRPTVRRARKTLQQQCPAMLSIPSIPSSIWFP